MTTTARGLAINTVNICGVPNGNDRENLIYSIEQAILDAETRGRESVLSNIPKARAEVFDKIWNGHNTPTFDETFNATVDYFLAKLKEPT